MHGMFILNTPTDLKKLKMMIISFYSSSYDHDIDLNDVAQAVLRSLWFQRCKSITSSLSCGLKYRKFN